MRKIAFYGKGGSGKSTIVSNLSALFAADQRRVLHIGCDPKHDSTRNLLHGEPPVTAVDLFKKMNPAKITADDLVMRGHNGIDCIEVGGPEPGAGCAGLGIIKTLELITNIQLLERPYDFVFFDVLGDVVCGGFATPLRMNFAREVYIVVSSEMMSLYAANNISRGIVRYAATGDVRLAGFIGNQRSADSPTGVLSAFADRLGAPLAHVVPWNRQIPDSERLRQTAVEAFPDGPAAAEFNALAKIIDANSSRNVPTPMTDEEFEEFFLSSSAP